VSDTNGGVTEVVKDEHGPSGGRHRVSGPGWLPPVLCAHEAKHHLYRRLREPVHGEPTTKHLNMVKCILCYIAGTITYNCHYRNDVKELKLLGYNNADMGRRPHREEHHWCGVLPRIKADDLAVLEAKGHGVIVMQSRVYCRDNDSLPGRVAGTTAR
jgi:hypothetical protein